MSLGWRLEGVDELCRSRGRCSFLWLGKVKEEGVGGYNFVSFYLGFVVDGNYVFERI